MTYSLESSLDTLNIALRQDILLRTLIHELSGILQQLIGQQVASG